MTDKQAVAEASRCLYCNDICNICIGVCPNFANVSFEAEKSKIPIYTLTSNGSIKSEITDYLNIEQVHQIFNIGDFCNECGNCNTFCPTNGAPYITKPKFYLTRESFDKEDNCYYLSNNSILYKSNGNIEKLTLENDNYIFSSDDLFVEFSNNYEIVKIKSKLNTTFNLDKNH
ncbi:MAG: hypothetical protein H6611_01040 [Ignavibacteriales bacterium]|nr:hypothetical protein [Ignavibacteriales bacterium]